jgi:replicative DNA helicase
MDFEQDLDIGIVAACVLAGREGIKQLNDAGVTEEMIAGVDARRAYSFVRTHVREHGATPSYDLFRSRVGFTLPTVQDPLSVFIELVKERHLWNMQVSFLQEFGEMVNQRKPMVAQERFESFQRELRTSRANPAVISSIFSAAEEVIQAYNDAKAGKMGIPSPWPQMDSMTLGWNPGDFIVFVARLGIGKTWALLMMAEYAWRQGHQVLFISPEMAKHRLATRVFSLNLGLSYADVRKGQLDDIREPIFYKSAMALKDEEGFDYLGSNFKCTPENIEDAVAITRPDIVFVDGLYLVKGNGKNRTETTANVADELKSMAGTYGIPFVTSTQFNRDVKRNDPSKIREGDSLGDVWLDWDFDKMLFKQQEADRDDGFTDDEFTAYADKATEDTNAILDARETEGPTDGGIPF